MEIKFDINQALKHFVKDLKQQRRKKFMYGALWTSVISGILFFNSSKNTVLGGVFGMVFGLIFLFSTAMFFYNFTYPLAEKLDNLSKRIFK